VKYHPGARRHTGKFSRMPEGSGNQYSDDAWEFIKACDDAKRKAKATFLTASLAYEVLINLGYHKESKP